MNQGRGPGHAYVCDSDMCKTGSDQHFQAEAGKQNLIKFSAKV